MNITLKKTAAAVINFLNLPTLFDKQVIDATVLMFHKVNPKYFEKQIMYLKNKYTPINEAQLISYYEGKKLPLNSVLLTFDDGYASFYRNAWPILKKHNVPATIFLTTGYINTKEMAWFDKIDYVINNTQKKTLIINGSPFSTADKFVLIEKIFCTITQMPDKDKKQFIKQIIKESDVVIPKIAPYYYTFLTHTQIKDMRPLITFSGHSNSHPVFTMLSEEEKKNEILKERKTIKAQTFCYPFGICDQKSSIFIKKEGYKMGFSSEPGRNTKQTNKFLLKRIGINSKDDLNIFAIKLSRLGDSFFKYKKKRFSGLEPIRPVTQYKKKLTIVIKALNEEQNVERAIKSSLKETKKFDSEIILADSLSTDKTIQLAKKYPTRIVQLKNRKDRSCGVGPQLGYQYAHGEYVYIQDGDMEFEPGFIEKALKYLEKNREVAGVGGSITEMRTDNIIFKRRQKARKKKFGEKDKLEMGGLYRRRALEDVNYFSNKNLHAYEEADLGYRLKEKGWRLVRLNAPGIKHYGYSTNTAGAFKKRWQTGYVKGSGEFLRASLGKPYFFKTWWQIKIYIIIIKWWIGLIVSLALMSIIPWLIQMYLLLTILFLILFLLKKRSFKEFGFSLLSWHYHAAGLLKGFFSKQDDPEKFIPSKVIK